MIRKKSLALFIFFVYLTSLITASGFISYADTQTTQTSSSPAASSADQITVSTEEEFVEALGSNRKIILKPGVYDLSSMTHTDSSDGTVAWRPVNDGEELNISGLSNLTIEGSGRDNTELRTSSYFAAVLRFKNCSGLTIRNLKAGHEPKAG